MKFIAMIHFEKHKRLMIFLCFVLTIQCNNSSQNKTQSAKEKRIFIPENINYAQGFEIKTKGKIKIVSVNNPWQGARDVSFEYVLAPKDESIPEDLKQYPVVRTPVKRIICFSTTHAALIDTLGEASSIKAMSGSKYLYDKALRKKVKSGEILEIGYDQNINYELIVSLQPDLVMLYGVEGGQSPLVNKLSHLGIPCIYNADYLEKSPLGKAEWIKFIAAFYEKDKLAGTIFQGIATNYNQLKSVVDTIKQKPSVFAALPWKGTWWIPGGKSYVSKLIEDAGGHYLWCDNYKKESIPVHIETVLQKAGNADIWINPGGAQSLEDIISVDERLNNFNAFKTGKIFNNLKRNNKHGGNDYWESGIIKPDLILKDMIHIFHPAIFPEHKFYFYQKIN